MAERERDREKEAREQAHVTTLNGLHKEVSGCVLSLCYGCL